MPVVTHLRVQQGYRPWTNPRRAMLGAIGSLGDNSSDPNCVAGMPYDVNGDPCQGPAVTSAPLAGAPRGSQLLYSATWQVSPSHLNVQQILASVLQVLKSSASVIGFQVVNASQSGGLLTVSNFNVQIQLFVSGPGFGQPNDAGSFVDHAYNQVTGLMPVVSSTVVTALPAGVQSAPTPTGTSPFPSGAAQTFTSWVEDNALWLGIGVVAAIVLPKVL
jgi:hypothetical protein